MNFSSHIRAAAAGLNRRIWLVFLCGLLVGAIWTLVSTAGYLGGGKLVAQNEMTAHADVQGLYECAEKATWADMPKWWLGQWNFVHGYYRPLTSMLFLAEQKTFGLNFDAYNFITFVMHGLNAALLYTLVFLILRGSPLNRAVCGLVAVRFFATPAATYFYAPRFVLYWWPAQNDPLCLIFVLSSLILLQLYLNREQRVYMRLSLLAFFLAIASKELGHVTMPFALCLIWNRHCSLRREMMPYAALGIAMIVFRKVAIPHTANPVLFSTAALVHGLRQWTGPLAQQLSAQVYWPAASAASALTVCVLGLKYRWKWWLILAGVSAAMMISTQILSPLGGWASLFVGDGPAEMAKDAIFMLAAILFWKYRKDEPGLAAAAMFVLGFVPALGYAGLHYDYLPGVFLALADAVFCACLFRLAGELWDRGHPDKSSKLEVADPA